MIRMAAQPDVERMLEIYSPYVLNTTCSFEYEPPTPEAFLARFLGYTAQFPWLVYEEEGVILGYAYASAPFSRAAYRWCCEVSIYLDEAARGRGMGRQLYRVLEAVLQLQGYRMCYSVVTDENTGSIAFHEAVGYRRFADFPNCGYKFDHWLGTVWLEKQLNSVENPSDFPVSWQSIVNFDRIFAKILDNLSLS